MLHFATIALGALATVALGAVPTNPSNWKASQASVTVSHARYLLLCSGVFLARVEQYLDVTTSGAADGRGVLKDDVSNPPSPHHPRALSLPSFFS